jgi:hypothetical protein
LPSADETFDAFARERMCAPCGKAMFEPLFVANTKSVKSIRPVQSRLIIGWFGSSQDRQRVLPLPIRAAPDAERGQTARGDMPRRGNQEGALGERIGFPGASAQIASMRLQACQIRDRACGGPSAEPAFTPAPENLLAGLTFAHFPRVEKDGAYGARRALPYRHVA